MVSFGQSLWVKDIDCSHNVKWLIQAIVTLGPKLRRSSVRREAIQPNNRFFSCYTSIPFYWGFIFNYI